MQAIIMAGGAGIRLRPLTNDVPKPMVNIIDKPVLEYIIRRLKKYDIYDIGITLNYKPEAIMNYFNNGEDYGVKIRYFIESKPLGTAGGVKAAEKFLDDNFMVLSGDSYDEVNYDELAAIHFSEKQPATIAVKEVDDITGYGVVKVSDNIVTEFIEKPAVSTEKLVNTGIYMFKHEVLDLIPNGFYDFGHDLFPRLVNNIAAYKTNNYWSDIGTLERYYQTNLYVSQRLNS